MSQSSPPNIVIRQNNQGRYHMLLFGKDKRHLLKSTQNLGSQVTVGVGD